MAVKEGAAEAGGFVVCSSGGTHRLRSPDVVVVLGTRGARAEFNAALSATRAAVTELGDHRPHTSPPTYSPMWSMCPAVKNKIKTSRALCYFGTLP